MYLFNKIPTTKEVDNRLSLSATDINIVFDGNSLTEDIEDNQDYPKYIRDRLTPLCNTLTFNSFGVSGQSTLDMISDATTQIDTLVDVNKLNIIVAYEDVNSILNDGRTGQQNFDDFNTYFTDRIGAGFDIGILVIGYYPRKKLDGTYNKVEWETRFPEQENYRELVRNETSPPWDLFVDLTVHPSLGGASDQFLTPSLWRDSVHLTLDGYHEMAEWVFQNGILKNFKK